MQVWFLFCRDLGYIDEATSLRWSDEAVQLGKMIFSLVERRTGFHAGKAA